MSKSSESTTEEKNLERSPESVPRPVVERSIREAGRICKADIRTSGRFWRPMCVRERTIYSQLYVRSRPTCCNPSTEVDNPRSPHRDLNESRNTFNPSPMGLVLMTSDLERSAMARRREGTCALLAKKVGDCAGLNWTPFSRSRYHIGKDIECPNDNIAWTRSACRMLENRRE